MLKEENWIDFESEMSSVIKWFDFKVENLMISYDYSIDKLAWDISNELLDYEKKEKIIDMLEEWKNKSK